MTCSVCREFPDAGEGDVLVCLGCGNVMVYGEDLKLRGATIEELLDLLDDQRVADAISAGVVWRKHFGEAKNAAGNTGPLVL